MYPHIWVLKLVNPSLREKTSPISAAIQISPASISTIPMTHHTVFTMHLLFDADYWEDYDALQITIPGP
jgi:hypothetical protein